MWTTFTTVSSWLIIKMNKMQELDRAQIIQARKRSTKTKNARPNNSRMLRTQMSLTSPSRDQMKPDSKCNKFSNLSRGKVRSTPSSLLTRANNSRLTKFRKDSPSSTKTSVPSRSRDQLHLWRSYRLFLVLWELEIRHKNKYRTPSKAASSTSCKLVQITSWINLRVWIRLILIRMLEFKMARI